MKKIVPFLIWLALIANACAAPASVSTPLPITATQRQATPTPSATSTPTDTPTPTPVPKPRYLDANLPWEQQDRSALTPEQIAAVEAVLIKSLDGDTRAESRL